MGIIIPGTLGASSSPDSADPGWIAGKYGKALSFDGTNDFVSTSSFSSITGTMTMSAWVKRNTDTDMAIWGTDYGGTRAVIYSGNLYVSLKIGGTLRNLTLNANMYIPSGTWHYVTMTYDGNTLSAYIDSIKITSLDVSGSITNAGNEYGPGDLIDIGHGEAWGQKYMNGFIDDVRIYNYARTQKQIVADMNAGHPAVGSPVGSAVAYYKFDEGQGTLAHNAGNGGSALNGTLTNMSSPATATSGWTSSGKFGKGLNFDGQNDNIAILADLTANNDWTMSVWFNGGVQTSSSDSSIRPLIIQPETGGSGLADHISMIRNGLVNHGAIQTRVGDGTAATSPNSYNDNVWHYATSIRSGSSVFLYVDGIRVATGTVGTQTSASITRIGGDTSITTVRYFTGFIDEVKIYNYALSDDEVKLEYNQGKSIVMGSTGTTATGTADNSSLRAYCPPGNVEGNCANGLNPAPVAEWNLNEGTGQSVNDTSGNANTGQLGSAPGVDAADPTWTNGKDGKGLKFDGSDDYVSTTTAAQALGTSDFTIEAWALYKAIPVDASFAGGALVGTATLNPSVILGIDSGWMKVYTRDSSGTTQLIQAHGLVLNTWYHLVGVRRGTTLSLYYNGVWQKDQTGDVRNVTNGETLKIGQGYLGFHNGSIDQVKIYNYARTPAQIAWDYNQGAPVAWYKLDECSGNTVHSQNETYDANLNGTINIGATLPQSSVGTCGSGVSTEAWNNGTNGKFNGSLNFDGVDDYITVSSFPLSNSFAYSVWVNVPASWTDSYPTVIGVRNAGSTLVAELIARHSGVSDKAHFQIRTGGQWYSANSNSALSSGWHHLVAVYDSTNSNIKLYVDGKQHDSQNGPSSFSLTDTLYIGKTNSTDFDFNGQIDDVRVYNYALTPLQIKEIYNNSAVRFE